MKLTELIKYLTNPERLGELYQEYDINTESEALLIYLENNLGLESEVFILGIEETDDELVFEKDGVKYIQMFPVNYAVELIESDLNLKNKGYSDIEIANRLLDYRQKDA